MRNMVNEYGKKKAKNVYYGLENKMKKTAPKKAEKVFNLQAPVKKTVLRGTKKAVMKGLQAPVKKTPLMQKVAKAVPKVMERFKGAMPAKLKDIKAKLKR